jgi:hypothetical protein
MPRAGTRTTIPEGGKSRLRAQMPTASHERRSIAAKGRIASVHVRSLLAFTRVECVALRLRFLREEFRLGDYILDACGAMMETSPRQADVDITPEMLRAGALILEAWDYDSASLSVATYHQLAELLYARMRRLEPASRR